MTSSTNLLPTYESSNNTKPMSVQRTATLPRQPNFQMERKILADTSESRRSALYMSLAPAAILAMYWAFLDPSSVERLFVEPAGQLVLLAAVLLNIVAYVWAQRILDSDL